jgi:pyridoxamine 5'-phosphate oxidase-like protein
MGKTYESIDEKLKEWLLAQKVFFVATAPLSQEGHVNCSPKDGESFRTLDERTVVYLDLTGSGVETIAHVKENERIVLMFCAFTGAPKIVRLHGHGEIIEPKHPEFESIRAMFPLTVGVRSFIKVHLTRISDSCGYGVPLYEFRGHRTQLEAWAKHKGEESLVEYQMKYNSQSIDRLEGVALRDQSSNEMLKF